MSISSTASSTPPIQFDSLEGGLNTSQIISAYLQQDEQPLLQLESQQTTVGTQIAAYQSLQSQMQSFEQAAQQLSGPTAFASAVSASSSDSSVATASTSAGAAPGSVSFSVDQLAAADSLISSGTVASTSDVVASGDLLVAAGGSGLGLSSLSGSGLALGAHSIDVTQASSAASVTAGTALANPVTISSSNDQLAATVDGQSVTYTIANGTYTASQLAAAAASASGGALGASVNSSGDLVLSTSEQGSSATLAIGAGSANAALGLSQGQSATGTDAVVSVDGEANTVSSIAGDGSTVVTLSSASGGTITAQLSGAGLSTGSITAQNVSLGNGSLASVVSAINSADAGLSAQALQVAPGSYALEVTSEQTGAANDVSLAPGAFSGSALGTLDTAVTGQNAVVSLGGSGGYELQSSSNTVSGLLPGVDISLGATSSAPVTISVQADGTAAAQQVQSLVTAANAVLSTIAADTSYDAATSTAGPLNSDYSLNDLAQQILSTVGSVIGNSSVVDSGTAGSAAGLSLGTDTINFDASTFATDFASNPAAVAQMFTQAGSFAPASGSPAASGDVSLVYASDQTQPGGYDVTLSQSATQASDTGTTVLAPGASVGSSASYTVSSGAVSASYAVSSGQTLAQVASGLDGAFAAAGLGLSAQVVSNSSGQSLQITSSGYGSAATFVVSAASSDPLGLASSVPFAGTDVAGTINGVTATGEGQVLSAPASDPVLAGLSLLVQTPGITSSTDLGSFDYTPGIAQGLASLAAAATGTGGLISTSITSLQATSSQLGSQISLEQQVVDEQQQALEQEFTKLESTLATLGSESSFLSSAFGSGSSSSSSIGSTGASPSGGTSSATTTG